MILYVAVNRGEEEREENDGKRGANSAFMGQINNSIRKIKSCFDRKTV